MKTTTRMLGAALLGVPALLLSPAAGQAHGGYGGYGYGGYGYRHHWRPPPPAYYRPWYPPRYYAPPAWHYRHNYHHGPYGGWRR